MKRSNSCAARPGVWAAIVLSAGLAGSPFVRVARAVESPPGSSDMVVAVADGDEDDGPDGAPPLADKRIIDYQMWRMSQDLELTDAEAARVFPRMRRLGEAQSDLRRDRLKVMKQLRTRLSKASPEEVEGLVRQVRDTEGRRLREIADLEDSVLAALSPRQQAQYLVSRESVMRDLHRMAEEARGRRPGGGSPRMGGRPGGPPGGFPRPGGGPPRR